jgi:hypothetical protein
MGVDRKNQCCPCHHYDAQRRYFGAQVLTQAFVFFMAGLGVLYTVWELDLGTGT